MLINVLSIIGLVLLLALFIFLAWRAWRSPRLLLRWGGALVSGLLALVLAALTVFSLLGMRNLVARVDLPVPDVVVERTPEQIARGQHLADSFCTPCHSTTGELPLAGGVDLGEDLTINLGKFISSNLTPAGSLQDWTDGEIVRAMRNGIGQDGRRLVIMSNVRSRNMSDEDLLALIAYLRSSEPVTNDVPDTLAQPNLLGLIMSGSGMMPPPPPPILSPVSAPPKAATAEYGEYILSYNDCRDCHGEDLTGGVKGQLAPIGPHLGGVKAWTAEQFISAMRTGVTPFNNEMDETMPWESIGRLDDVELTALYLALTSMP
jgi:mono/diheme cytochrome c family protein